MPVEEGKALESTEPAVDPPARCTSSKAAAAASDASFTPMVATRPAIPKPTPSSSRKGKEVVHDSSPVFAFLIRKQRRSTPLSPLPQNVPVTLLMERTALACQPKEVGRCYPLAGGQKTFAPSLKFSQWLGLLKLLLWYELSPGLFAKALQSTSLNCPFGDRTSP
jgi:hypothetical protein